MWKKIKAWWLIFWLEEYELEIFFPAHIETDADGVKKETWSPKIYKAKSIKKVTPTHFQFIDLDGIPVEIRTVTPVGYNLKKIY